MVSKAEGDFSDMRQQLRRAVSELCPPGVVRQVLEGREAYATGLWRHLAADGWLGASFLESGGGGGLGDQVAAVLAEEAGRALAPLPLRSIHLAAEAVARHGGALRATVLPALLEGRAVGAWAISEGQARSGERGIAAEVVDGRLTGVKTPVLDGLAADVAVVAARGAGGRVGLFLVELAQAGVAREALPMIDPAKPAARLTFAQAVATELDAGWDEIARLTDRAAVMTAFEQVGATEAAITMARDYALIRHAFGRPIGAFQAIKHKLANCHVNLVMARAAAIGALQALDTDAASAAIAACAARIHATQALETAARELVQTHGGIGCSWEHDAQLFYRRARHLALALEPLDAWRERLADLLIPRVMGGDTSVLGRSGGEGEARFRQQARAWLAAHAPAFERMPGEASDSPEALARAKAWHRLKQEAGYVGLGLPSELGGQDSPSRLAVFREEEGRYRLSTSAFFLNDGVIIPVLQALDAQAHLDRFAASALSADELWCEMFSEPGAGSDVAAITTRGVRSADGDWIINGGKVWTSFATWCDWSMLLVRTDPDVPKHRGMTMFLLDLRTPGVEVRPLRTMHGDSEFTQTFLTDVRIPDAYRLGEVGDGWKIFNQTLLTERLSLLSHPAFNQNVLVELIRKAATAGRLDDPGFQRELADYYALLAGVGQFQAGLLDDLCRGRLPGPEASLGKLAMAKPLQAMAAWGMELSGETGLVVDPNDVDDLALSAGFFYGATYRVAGGSDEVMLNLVAEQILGLPRDQSPDRNLPFSQRANARAGAAT